MQHTYIHEVVARDGLQIEPQFVPTEQKVELIDALSATGVAKIEVTSFVSPKAVPNLRDAETVMAGIRRNPEVKYVALIANLKGAERAIAARADEVNLVVSVSETHNRANVRRSTDASFEGFREIMRELDGTGIAVAGALSTAFGCPFEGEQAPGRLETLVIEFPTPSATPPTPPVLNFTKHLQDCGPRDITSANRVVASKAT